MRPGCNGRAATEDLVCGLCGEVWGGRSRPWKLGGVTVSWRSAELGRGEEPSREQPVQPHGLAETDPRSKLMSNETAEQLQEGA